MENTNKTFDIYEISFEYMDIYSCGRWNKQSCQVRATTQDAAVNECKRFYGLGTDCDYKITSVRKM